MAQAPSRGLVGRARELGVIRGLVRAGTGGALLVVGDVGIGKSALLDAAGQEAADRGWSVLRSTGVEVEAGMPYAGLHQLLVPLLGGIDLLPPAQAEALGAAFGLADAGRPDPFLISLAAFGLVVEATSSQPRALLADDVQWFDQPSQEALGFLARRAEGEGFVLIGTLRTEAAAIAARERVPTLEVAPLADADARALLALTGPDLGAAGRARVLREAAGNPLALTELPRAHRRARGEGPLGAAPLTARLERAFGSRHRALSPEARDLLLVAAVSDGAARAEVVAAAGLLGGHPVGDLALRSAVDARLVVADERSVVFRHPLVRSGVLHAEGPARRRAAHAALARVLESDPYRRAWHSAHAVDGPDDEVAATLEEGAAVAIRRGSVALAIRNLERAAELTSDRAARARRRLVAAEHAFELGRADLVDRLLAAAEPDVAPADHSRVTWLREVFNDGVPGDADRVLALCEAARAAAEHDLDLALNLALAAALRCWWADTGDAARAAVADLVDRLASVAPGVAADPRAVAATAVAEPVDRAAQVVAALRAVDLEEVTDPAVLRLLGMAAHAVGEPVRSVDLLTRSASRFREEGRLAFLTQSLTMQVLDLLELGEWDRAAAAVDEGHRLAHESSQPIWDTGSQVLGAVVAALRGRNDEAQAVAAEAELAAGGRHLNNLLACAQVARGLGWVAAGHYPEAYAALRRLYDPADPARHATEQFHGVAFLAEAALHVGEVEDARAVVERLHGVARITPAATLRVHLSYADAVLAEPDRAEPAFLAALAADLVRWPWHRARLELAYGIWLRRQRRVAEARERLRSALTTLERIGADRWADQARLELRAAGENVGTVSSPVRDLLSPQELQIARMAADGLSNREIGERLFLSPRTVGSHLYRIFPKLAITSRAQLAVRLGEV